MKVCQLCAVDFTLEKFLLPLIDGMRERGWDVIAVCSGGPATENLQKKGYSIISVRICRGMNPFAALKSLWSLVKLFRRERFEILHVHTPVAALIGRLAAKVIGIPFVIYTAHGFYFHEGMSNWKYRLFVCLERIAGRWTDLLFTQSTEDAKTAVKEKIMTKTRVLAIGNGVDANRFDPDKTPSNNEIRASLGIPIDAFVVGMIGRQVREKGVAEFLKAVVELSKQYPKLWVLLVGERLPSDHANGVSKELYCAKTAMKERLVALGLRNDIPELINAMDLFCLPSWREGMPRTIIEAMMMAKPVLATNIRGSREEVVHEETGLLVPVRSIDQLSYAIERFLINPSWGKKLGVAGRVRALKNYEEMEIVKLQLDKISEFI